MLRLNKLIVRRKINRGFSVNMEMLIEFITRSVHRQLNECRATFVCNIYVIIQQLAKGDAKNQD